MNDNGGTYDPQGDRENPGSEGGQREIVPWEYPAMEAPGLQPPLPTGRQAPKQPQPPIPVQRRTLSIMMAMIVVLLLVVGGLAFAVLGSSKTPVAAAPPVSSTSPSAVDSTGAATDLSPSPDPSASPSGDLSTDTSTPDATDTSTPDSPSDSPTVSDSFSPIFGSQPLGNPVDGGVDVNQDEHVSNVDYPDSIGLYCPTNGMLDWDVAGFTTFTAVFGIPDDARSATGIINTVTFSDQNGHALGSAKTSLGQPAHLQFALKGAARLVMTCDRQGSNDSVNNYVTLAAPVLSTS